MNIGIRRRMDCEFVELLEEIVHVHALFLDGNCDGVVAATAVVEMQIM